MANFGFARLTVVAPYEPHWREAQSAVGAESILHSASKTETLSEAIADCTLVLGTGTVARRKPEQTVISLPSLAPVIDTELPSGGRIALVFGPEKHGLTRDDLALCHHLVEIPTDPGQPSMNLGQAVAVCLYELVRLRANSSQSAATTASASTNSPVTSRDLDVLGDAIAQTMTAANYSPSAMHDANRHDLHLFLRRLALSRRDARRTLGLFRRILWRLQHRAGPHQT